MTTRKQESDDNLVRAAGKGDAEAFARLLERHRPGIRHLIYAVVQDHEQAEDLTQETFCRVYRHLEDYTARDQFVPWVKRIALNLARNFLRDRLRDRSRTEAAAQFVRQEQVHPNHESDPAAILHSRLLQNEVRGALEALKPEQQQTLLLYYFAGRTIPEIAAQTGVPEGTVKSRLFHARRQIRDQLR